MEEEKTFVRQISHEIRTPLNVASLGLDVLRRDIDNSSAENKEQLKAIVDEIKGACDITLTTLNDVLLVEKINARLLSLEKTPISATSFINDAVRVFRLQVG